VNNTAKLSDRVRPNSEAAPWVVEEIKKLERKLERLKSSNQQLAGEIESWQKVFDRCCEREAQLRIQLEQLEGKL
jgi:chromosome segregation ATPase